MGVKERKEREREERRELILNAANDIITSEGFDNLSIRKIADRIEYSPAIIYHYFRDKDDIVNHLMKKGYKKIVDAVSSVQVLSVEPAQKLREMMRNYIDAALLMPDEYIAVQLNRAPGVLEYTSSLFEGASGKKPALRVLFQCLKEIYRDKDIDDSIIEMTAQVTATSTIGLIMRLIIEQDLISEGRKKKLIEQHIKITLDGIVQGGMSE